MGKLASLVMVSALAVLGGCSREPPSFLRGIKCEPARNCISASSTFERMMQKRYPVGSDAKMMIEELQKAGFRQSEGAGFSRCQPPIQGADGAIVPCPGTGTSWKRNLLVFAFHPYSLTDCTSAAVIWSSDQSGKLTNVEGRFGPMGTRCAWP